MSEEGEEEVPAELARAWLLASSVATLGTLGAQRGIEGYPFGSVVPFALTAAGAPIVQLAEIAAHTANLRRDPRASLFVRQLDGDGDPQAGWRVTVLGTLERLVVGEPAGPRDVVVSGEELEDVEARFLERVPAARQYGETHDFAFWRFGSIVKGRYIAGFGRICWLEGPALLRDPSSHGLAESGPGAIEHMNSDHAGALVEMVAGRYGFTPESARMTAIDRTGLQIRTTGPDRLLHFSFEREVAAADLRIAVIDVLRMARSAAVTP